MVAIESVRAERLAVSVTRRGGLGHDPQNVPPLSTARRSDVHTPGIDHGPMVSMHMHACVQCAEMCEHQCTARACDTVRYCGAVQPHCSRALDDDDPGT